MSLQYKKGDIVLTQGRGTISALIRKFTRHKGEPMTKVNHVGIVVEDGDDKTVVIVEALNTVKKHTMWSQYALKGDKVAIYRPLNLDEKQIDAIVAKANSYVGAKYGWGKIAAHFLDWVLGSRYIFRRLANMDNHPICSWLVAKSYEVVGKKFGVESGEASPDDIWDYVSTSKYYRCVRALREVF